MALEAWGHLQIEAGRPFEEVLHDVLGPDGSSLAFVSVASRSRFIALASGVRSRVADGGDAGAAPIRRCARLRDITGVDRMLAFAPARLNTWPVKRADLDARPSRRNRLSDTIGYYVFHGEPKQLEMLRAALEQARNEIRQKPDEDEDPINGLRATAERAVRMTNAEHWPLVKVTRTMAPRWRSANFNGPRRVRPDRTWSKAYCRPVRSHQNVQRQNSDGSARPVPNRRRRSSPKVIEWAKEQPPTSSRKRRPTEAGRFRQEWDRRAVTMAATLAAAITTAPDRSEVMCGRCRY